MGKVVVCNIMSLDGYYSGPGDDVMALPFDEGFDAYNLERLRAAGTLLLGRRSYELFKGYWPPVEQDPDARPVAREISRHNNALEKVVVSDTLSPEDTAPWHNTRIVGRSRARDHVAALRDQGGKEILVFGSHTLWNDLLAQGLVDEVHLMIGPAVLSGGTPTFETRARIPLRLIDARPLEGSQLVLVTYGAAD